MKFINNLNMGIYSKSINAVKPLSFTSNNLDANVIASKIDHTYLPAAGSDKDANKKTIKELCQETKDYNFASVCVRPDSIKLSKNYVTGTNVKVATVIGFPKNKINAEEAIKIVGNIPTKAKIAEAKKALKDGADELDIVVNVSDIKMNNKKALIDEMKQIIMLANGKLSKFIIESGLLTDKEKSFVVECIIDATMTARMEKNNPAIPVMVKTSTGMVQGVSGATVEDIKLIKNLVTKYDMIGIKASGGIKDAETAQQMIEAGADRIGTSSGVAIIKGTTGASAY